jgi:LEA14-like dessication related protein
LELTLGYQFEEEDSFAIEVAVNIVFPMIREPLFEIISIAIVQADIINTEFKTTLKVNNPNIFPVSLVSISYNLYGDNILWALGSKNDLLHIPAQSSRDSEFRFIMNFIDMSRRLFNEIIAMQNVHYRFTGEATMETDVPYLPSFKIYFERSGLSEVLK